MSDDEKIEQIDVEDVDVDGSDEDDIIRQDSDLFNDRLSADSWIEVVSVEENDPGEHFNPNFISEVDDEEKQIPTGGDDPKTREVEGLDGRSVLDCVVEMLKGARVSKKKMFKRYGERWIWLAEDLLSLNWKKKQVNGKVRRLNLTKVKKLKSLDNYIYVETTEGKKVQLTLNNPKETLVWITGLSCLVPRDAKVSGPTGRRNMEKFDPLKDAWHGKLVSSRKVVNQYILLGGIGKGAFGKVKLALSKEDKCFYALKISNKGRQTLNVNDKGTREEIAILRRIRHPNVMHTRDVLYDDEVLIQVVEYTARGVVMDSSKLEGVKPLSEDGVREIMRDVVCGLEYLHVQRIVHRDIKPDNLLRAGDGTVKLGDLGEAKYYAATSVDAKAKSSAPGTPAFIAPELCMSDKSPKAPVESYAADVWSLGATIYYMVYGRAPFLAKNVFEIYEAICSQKLTFPDSPKISKKLKDLLKNVSRGSSLFPSDSVACF
mmetsp:Transcript_13101/g.33229  ORF Transcript_13101/g.33229 Transcript_13101/m.33229 type:complete len:488 (-) Transcript_13101:283-1746(-)